MSDEPHYLICDRLNRVAMVVDGDNLAEAQAEYLRRVHRPAALVILDLGHTRRMFRNLAGAETRVFDRSEVAAVAGTTKHVIFGWVADGLVRPSVRSKDSHGPGHGMAFNWRDAFIAAALGSLGRGGCDLRTLREASRVLYNASDMQEKVTVA
jgi:hypothetical protein